MIDLLFYGSIMLFQKNSNLIRRGYKYVSCKTKYLNNYGNVLMQKVNKTD